MTGTSRYFQVRDEILLEYIYTDQANPDQFSTSENGLLLLQNFDTGVNYLFSEDGLEDDFGNVRDRSAVLLDSEASSYGYLDIDKPFLLNDQLSNLTNSDDLTINFQSNYSVTYDTVRIHFASGYDFEGVDGFIFEAKIVDNFSRLHNLSSIVYRRSDSWADINPRPFLIGGTEYSTFIEVKIPSTYFLVQERVNNPTDLSLLNSIITSNVGININENLKFNVTTINSTTKQNNQTYFAGLDKVEFSIPIEDEFEGVTSNVEEASDGDYYILSAKYNDVSIEDYMSLLNSQSNSNWIILHNLYVSEQIDTTLIETSSESWIQESNFSDVRFWRPVIRNSFAVAYVLDYTIRLFNRVTNEQIIKRSVLSFSDVAKYGKSLDRIELGEVPVIDEIYNVVQGNQINVNSIKNNLATSSVEFVANFFDKQNILISNIAQFTSEESIASDTFQNITEKQYKQGELTIALSPFDNYLKFVLLRNVNNEVSLMNLSQLGEIMISFTDNNENQISFASVAFDSVSPSSGEVLFYIPSTKVKEIIKFQNKEFYITLRNSNGNDNLMYSGKFTSEAERTSANGLNFINDLQNTIDSKNSEISKLNSDISKRDLEIERLLALLAVKDEEILVLNNPESTISSTRPAKANLENIINRNSNVQTINSTIENTTILNTRSNGSTLKGTNIQRNS